MAEFRLGFLEKMVLGVWGYRAGKRIWNEQINKAPGINYNGYSVEQVKLLMNTAAQSHNFVKWWQYYEIECGFTTEQIIETLCRYDSNQYWYYFNIVKPV